jgi:hypothetical protein
MRAASRCEGGAMVGASVIAPISMISSILVSAELVAVFAELVRLPVRAVAAHLSNQLEIAVESLEASDAHRHRDLSLKDTRDRLGMIMLAAPRLWNGQWRGFAPQICLIGKGGWG